MTLVQRHERLFVPFVFSIASQCQEPLPRHKSQIEKDISLSIILSAQFLCYYLKAVTMKEPHISCQPQRRFGQYGKIMDDKLLPMYLRAEAS